MKLKKNDIVYVIAGKYKDKYGSIKKIIKKTNRVVIKDVTKAKKHKKPDNINPDGGVIDIETSIHISNVAYMNPKYKENSKKKVPKYTKIKYIFEDKKKKRYMKKFNKIIK